jgi:hypothetical protein
LNLYVFTFTVLCALKSVVVLPAFAVLLFCLSVVAYDELFEQWGVHST